MGREEKGKASSRLFKKKKRKRKKKNKKKNKKQ